MMKILIGLVEYGEIRNTTHNCICYDEIVASLNSLENEETFLVQSGKPVGIFRIYEMAPRGKNDGKNLLV
ncbi:hypothetical protein FOH38_06900 [Lysinibacillus fusiformis]|nr:hypothetical protein FOH38_06900 [Lysinibacillus fusiformis]